MAKNWTVREGFEALGKDNTEEVMELGKRFPLATKVIIEVGAGQLNVSSLKKLFGAMPDYLTMNKLNTALKGEAMNEPEDAEKEDTEESGVTPKSETKKADKKSEKKDFEVPDFESMTAGAMYDWGKANGVKFKSTKKADMIALLKEKFGSAKDTDVEDVEDEVIEKDYSKMSVKELFKECKSRGIKAEIKKPAKYYISLLEKDDAAKEKESEDEDDWEDEEDEVKDTKKPNNKSDKKDDEDDDEEDWDI